MPLPRVDFVRVLLPVLTKIAPEIFQAEKITRGKIIPINQINPMNDAQEARNLSREFRRQKRDDNTKDSSQVINLDRAIKCVEESGGKGGLVAQVVRKCVHALIVGGTGTGPNVTEDLLNPIVTCLRENALRQDTVRRTHRSSTYGRPAKGHGHGRIKPRG
jgi:L-asparaginase/Glu-tRNA(Gln) amidotransferase subunit D